MKKLKFWMVLPMVMVIFGLVFTGCKDEEPAYEVYVKSFNFSTSDSDFGSLQNGQYKGESITQQKFETQLTLNFTSGAVTKNVWTEDQISSAFQKEGFSSTQAKQAADRFATYDHYWVGIRSGSTLKIYMK